MKIVKTLMIIMHIVTQSIICIAFTLSKTSAQEKITISRALIPDKENLQIEIYNLGISDRRTNTFVKAEDDGTNMVFDMEQVKQPTYFKINGVDKRLSECLFLLSPNDNISIVNEVGKISFLGNNALVYECIYKQHEMSEIFMKAHPAPDTSSESLFQNLKYNFILAKKKESIIESYEGKIPTNLKGMLLADLRYGQLSYYYSLLKLKSVDKNQSEKFLSNIYKPDTAFDNSLLFAYPSFVINKYEYEQLKLDRKIDIKSALNFLEQNFKGRSQQQIMAYLLSTRLRSQIIDSVEYEHFLSYADADFIFHFKEYTKGRVSGSFASDFKLNGVDGNSYSLKDFRGKVIVMDFWFTGCGACRLLNPILEQASQKMRNERVAFLSISIDKKKEIWEKSLKGNKYSFPGAIKLYTEGLGDKHPIISDYNIKGYPTVVIISPEGKLLPLPVNPRSDKAESLLAVINSALLNQ
ncbi:TlpA family protein disulfide reductase [Sphingobacterium detergens]|uniref:Thiol-disulfide isomerase/thioredoxin n=1 Tax=Sphingobacterium detergens TaxID=1145106 RepID=A0A420B6Q7_SPHD1|nr:TlpA disulfide reductase family protein [Sphingobacterium detergens]RKE52397.1 thiol-disulfide isomerase/thioredoxin [Sphingobacterium detergens]